MYSMDHYFSELDPDLVPLVQEVRRIIKTAMPYAYETVRFHRPVYYWEGKRICTIIDIPYGRRVKWIHIALFNNLPPVESDILKRRRNLTRLMQISLKSLMEVKLKEYEIVRILTHIRKELDKEAGYPDKEDSESGIIVTDESSNHQ